MNAPRIGGFPMVGGFGPDTTGVSLPVFPGWVASGPVGGVVEWGIFLGTVVGLAMVSPSAPRDVLKGRQRKNGPTHARTL